MVLLRLDSSLSRFLSINKTVSSGKKNSIFLRGERERRSVEIKLFGLTSTTAGWECVLPTRNDIFANISLFPVHVQEDTIVGECVHV